MYAFVTGCLFAVVLAVAAWVVFERASISAADRADSPSVVLDAGRAAGQD